MTGDDIVYQNASFTVTRTTVLEGDGSAIALDDGTRIDSAGGKLELNPDVLRFEAPRICSETAMLQALYRMALNDHERLVIDEKTYLYMMCGKYGFKRNIPEGLLPRGPVFWAGDGFTTSLFTRDTAYSSWLGTAYILPRVVQSHLTFLHSLRRKIGYKITLKHEIPRLPDLPLEQTNMNGGEMGQKYNENCITRRTDDVVWVLGLWEVYKSIRDAALLDYIFDQFAYFDEMFYRYFLDPATGLYRGQSTFIDIGGAPYEGRSFGDCVCLKALSTNCLYAQCIKIAGVIAGLLAKDEEAQALHKRHQDLCAAIRTHFGAVNYHHLLDDDGWSSGRQEVLGLAFLTLFEIVPRDEGARLLADYHDGDFGRPLFWPFYDDEGVYHNNSTWPFADTIFALAEYKVGSRQEVIRKTFGKLARHARHGTFNEVLEWKSGSFIGCPGYIWSSASSLALVYRMIAGMDVDECGTVCFAPVLPPEMGDTFELNGIKVGEMTLNLRVTGSGDVVESCKINGITSECPVINYVPGDICVEVQLGGARTQASGAGR
ncbi:MAG: hypothetical protein RRC34_02355 [Lentisphaeria bacterium]|nr:hypothetical protein [Lentisphaeria bacterium]